jgi:hypothetical protein
MTDSSRFQSVTRNPVSSVAKALVAAVLAGGLLAACQTTTGNSSGPTASAGGTAPTALNKDWGSCQYRRCGYGK